MIRWLLISSLFLLLTSGLAVGQSSRDKAVQEIFKPFDDQSFGSIYEDTRKSAEPSSEIEDLEPAELFKKNRLSNRSVAPHFVAPWVAGLAVWLGPNASNTLGYFCGAVLIRPNWLVTSAICVVDGDGNSQTNTSDIKILHGSGDLNLALKYDIKNIIVHPSFTGRDYLNKKIDFQAAIALIEIKNRIKINANRLPSLNISDEFRENSDFKVFGWGSLYESGEVRSKLVQIDMNLIETALCNSPSWYAGRIRDDMLCAHAERSAIDACRGFSGSGLISFGSGRPKLVGIVSWGEGCARKRRPGVYTKLAHYRKWIEQTINANR